MRQHAIWMTGAMLAALTGSAARASEIVYEATFFQAIEGVPSRWIATDPVDITNGGTYLINSEDLTSPSSWSGGVDYTPITPNQPFEHGFVFELGVKGDPGPFQGMSWAPADGTVSGEIDSSNNGTQFSGGFTARDISFHSTLPVPQALLDLIQHPERIHINGVVNGNQLEVSLTIDPSNSAVEPTNPGSGSDQPPVFIPEPGSLAVWMVVLSGGATWYRKRAAKGKAAEIPVE